MMIMHHPTEIKSVLRSLKIRRAIKIIAVFQPREYQDRFIKDFSLSFKTLTQ